MAPFSADEWLDTEQRTLREQMRLVERSQFRGRGRRHSGANLGSDLNEDLRRMERRLVDVTGAFKISLGKNESMNDSNLCKPAKINGSTRWTPTPYRDTAAVEDGKRSWNPDTTFLVPLPTKCSSRSRSSGEVCSTSSSRVITEEGT